ncbi:MAG TPA: MDR family MFS transporter [Micromonosporaceae bacterium]
MADNTAVPAARTTDAKRSLMLLFSGLMLTMLLSSLNQTVLGTALPTMVGELHGVDQMLWVITAFILASTIAMPVYGKMGDLVGRKGLLIIAIILFMAGSVVGGLAENMTWLIVGRAIQGLGGGGLIILAQAIVADVVPARERGRYMGVMGGVFAFSSVAGPLLGGWFTEGPGWRWAFWINLPLGALALLAAVFLLRLPRTAGIRPRIDYPGMALLSVGTTCLVLVSTWGGSEYAWTSPLILGMIALTVVTGFAFVYVERRAAEPIMPLHLFRDRNFNLTTTAGLIIGVAMFGTIAYLPTYLQMVTGASAAVSGLLMVPMMGALLLTAIVSGQYVSRTGRYKWLTVAGPIVVGGATVALSTMEPDTSIWLICGYIAVMGAGLGPSMQLLVLIVQNSFPLREVGTATAANNYFRQIGATLGSGMVGSVFATRLTGLLAERLPANPAGAGAGAADSFTPAAVNALPDPLKEPIIASYNDALMPIFVVLAPLVVVAALLLAFIVEKPLATTLERGGPDEPPARPPAHVGVGGGSVEGAPGVVGEPVPASRP